MYYGRNHRSLNYLTVFNNRNLELLTAAYADGATLMEYPGTLAANGVKAVSVLMVIR